MNSLHDSVHRRGGVAATWELLREGFTSHQLTAAVRRNELLRARHGHYVCPHLHPAELAAIRVGGRLTGLAGARRHGMWTPGEPKLIVQVKPDARALRTPSNSRVRLTSSKKTRIKVEWSDRGARGTRSLVGPAECLRVIAIRESAMVAFVCTESALNRRLISRADLQWVLESIPKSRLGMLRSVEPFSESGGESLVSFHLRLARIPFRQQVVIADVGRVDFLIGDRLVVELDGAEFHTDTASFEEDRRRDAVLSALGYRTLRFSYRQIEQRPSEVLMSIRAAMARADHR